MRVKSQWFKPDGIRSPDEIAGAAAFIAWRIAVNALKNMRRARFEIDAGPRYFAFLAEILVFLVMVADRIAYRHFAPEDRVAFTTALANRAGEILVDNERDLVGGEAGVEGFRARKNDFIALFNSLADDYAQFDYAPEEGPDFGFLRYLATRVGDILTADTDRPWVVSQVMEVEAPEAAETLAKGLRGLLGLETRRPRRAAGQTGD